MRSASGGNRIFDLMTESWLPDDISVKLKPGDPLLLPTWNQWLKDCISAGLPETGPSTPPEDPVAAVAVFLEKLYLDHMQGFQHLLYRIDIPSERYHIWEQTFYEQRFTELALLVLRREMMKVMLRQYFSNRQAGLFDSENEMK